MTSVDLLSRLNHYKLTPSNKRTIFHNAMGKGERSIGPSPSYSVSTITDGSNSEHHILV